MKEDIMVACHVFLVTGNKLRYEKCKYVRLLVNHTIVWNRSVMVGLPNICCYLSSVGHSCCFEFVPL